MSSMQRRKISPDSGRTSRTVSRKDETRLLKFDDLHEWQKDNEYLLTGYRPASWSYKQSVSSIFKKHNESVNIWSHLLGAILFLAALISCALHLWQQSSTAGLVVAIYHASVVICFALSSTFHIFLNHSPEMHQFGNQLDHLGIVIVIWGSGIPLDFFAFQHDSIILYSYWAMSTAAAIGCSIFTLQPRFRHHTYRTSRIITYFLLGASTFVPVIHGVYLEGWHLLNQRASINHFLGLAILNGSGAIIYGMRIPEKWYPARFDLFGASHQIMHVMVIAGAISHWMGLSTSLQRYESTRS